MHKFLASFVTFIQQTLHLTKEDSLLLAISGGVDSVVMSHLFSVTHHNFSIAHCHFGLRGTTSDQDEAWVRALANKYKVDYHLHHFNVLDYAQRKKKSIQMAARELRHSWFQQLCRTHGFKKIATAHHGDDSLETTLLHLTKGTGIAGLRGILPIQGAYVRPLLFTTKSEIINYANLHKLTWREDHTNQSVTYQRNLLRLKVIPWLKKINPNLTTTFQLTAERLRQTEAMLQDQVRELKHTMHQQGTQDYRINITDIQRKSWGLLLAWELLKTFGFNYKQINNLWQQPQMSGKMITSSTHRLCTDRGHWVVSPRSIKLSKHYTITTKTKVVNLATCKVTCTAIPRIEYCITPSPTIAAIDHTKLHFPLTIRTWEPGDYFYPLGMRQKKKVSDFFIDAKITVLEKKKIWIITSRSEIVCILGHRIDERFKITSHTHTVYEIRRMKMNV